MIPVQIPLLVYEEENTKKSKSTGEYCAEEDKHNDWDQQRVLSSFWWDSKSRTMPETTSLFKMVKGVVCL